MRAIQLLLLLLGSIPARAQETRPTPIDLSRIVMVGASVTQGFSAVHLLSAAIRAPHEEPLRLGHSALYRDPLTVGKRQLEEAARSEATLVIALDFLFWYAYGPRPKSIDPDPQRPDAWRLERVEKGLADLATLVVPLFLGTVPDMRGADVRLLDASKIPSDETLTRVNELIHAWAKKRANVHLLPLARWNLEMRSGRFGLPPLVEPTLAPLPLEAILSPDRLHPSRAGYIVLGSWLLHELVETLGVRAHDVLVVPKTRIRDELRAVLPQSRPSK